MSLSARDQEALDRIADGIARSDANLTAMLDTFTRLTAGERLPAGEEVRQSRRRRRVRERGPRVRRLRARLRLRAVPDGLVWLPAAVILAVTAIIAITAVLSGGAKSGGCGYMRGLTCAGPVHTRPAAPRRFSQSHEQSPGDHALADVSPQPQVEVAADSQVVPDVIVGHAQRHEHARLAKGPPVLVAADQGAEKLVAP